MTKVYLLRKTGDIHKMGDDAVHYAGCPFYGPNEGNLDKARTFKSEGAAKATNEFKHWGYEIVPAQISIILE